MIKPLKVKKLILASICALLVLNNKAQDCTCFIGTLSAGSGNMYIESGIMKEHYGLSLGVMRFTPNNDTKSLSSQDLYLIYFRPVLSLFKYDFKNDIIFRTYLTTLISAQVQALSTRLGISTFHDNVMLLGEISTFTKEKFKPRYNITLNFKL